MSAVPMPSHDFETPVVERKAGLSQQEFASRYAHARKPVVLLDAMEGWTTDRWTPQFFSEHFGDRKVTVSRGNSVELYTINLNRFIEHVQRTTTRRADRSTQSRIYYLRNRRIEMEFPELLPDFTISKYFSPNWSDQWPLTRLLPSAERLSTELFIGPAGAMGPYIHRDIDMTHSWVSQIYGQKRVWLVAPQQTEYMYQHPEHPNRSLVNDFDEPDLERFPLVAKAKIASTVLNPGETVFIPAGWWHTAECLNASISISGNFVNDSNFSDFEKTIVLPRFRKSGTWMAVLNRSVLHLHGLLCRARDL